MARTFFLSLKNLRKAHFKIPLIYALVAGCWILFSDELVSLLSENRDTVITLSIMKGWFFVAVTALLLSHLIAHNFAALERSRAILAASEERFAGAFRLSPAAIAICGWNSGSLVDVNDAWLRTFGFERGNVLGYSLDELGVYSTAGEHQRLTGAIEGGRGVRNLELRLCRKGGESLEVLFSAEVIHLGSERYLLVVLSDITERRQAEAALKRQAAALKRQAQQLSERNRELARYNSASVGRELRVIELKQQVNALSARLGEPEPFPLHFLKGEAPPEAGGAAQGRAQD